MYDQQRFDEVCLAVDNLLYNHELLRERTEHEWQWTQRRFSAVLVPGNDYHIARLRRMGGIKPDFFFRDAPRVERQIANAIMNHLDDTQNIE